MSKTDYIAELGALALASRLRRLLNRLHHEGEMVYRKLKLNVKPKWFPVLHLLLDRSPLTLTEIARLMSMSHPSTIETIDELVSAGLVDSRKSDIDGRRRDLSLTPKGKRLCEQLRPIWEAFRVAGEEVIKDGETDFLEAIGELEQSILEKPMYNRIMTQLEKQAKHKKK